MFSLAKLCRAFLFVLLLFGMLHNQSSFAAIDANAPVVKLRHAGTGGCTENNIALDNCFTTIKDLNTWIRDTKQPDSTKPLIVEIGPGAFNGKFTCDNVGHISLRGSGRSVTILKSGMYFDNCDQISVSDLQINGDYYVIQWSGTGISTWTNVEVVGSGIGWYDDQSSPCDRAATKHYWFASRIEIHPYLTQAKTYSAHCGEHWFYGSEVTASHGALSGTQFPNAGVGVAIAAVGNTEVHVYGSVIRMLAPSVYQGTIASTNAVISANQASVHIHGTGIDVLSEVSVPISALSASDGAEIHSVATSYNLKTTGGATVSRIINSGGHVHAPYHWEHIPAPFDSVTGSDVTTDLVTYADGSQHPHLMIYDTSCASSKWFDAINKVCKP